MLSDADNLPKPYLNDVEAYPVNWMILVGSLGGAFIGGCSVIVADRLRDRSIRKYERARELADLYCKFIVKFQRALTLYSDYYSTVRLQEYGQVSSDAHIGALNEIQSASTDMQTAGWTLLFHEQNEVQASQIEKLVTSFDVAVEHPSQENDIASDFEEREGELKALLRKVISDARRIHRDALNRINFSGS